MDLSAYDSRGPFEMGRYANWNHGMAMRALTIDSVVLHACEDVHNFVHTDVNHDEHASYNANNDVTNGFSQSTTSNIHTSIELFCCMIPWRFDAPYATCL